MILTPPVIAGMDETVFNIVVTVVVYVAYIAFEAAKRKREGGPSIADELVQIEALHQLIETRARQLAHHTGWQRVVAPVWNNVLAPKVGGLYGWAQRLAVEDDGTGGWQLAHRREQLAWLREQLDELAGAAHGEAPVWLGSALYIALDELSGEVTAAFPAYPDPDIVLRGITDREELQHLYAAWAATLFGDVATAVLDKSTARGALRQIEAMPGSHEAHEAGQPPDWVRGVALAYVLGVPFRSQAPDGEIVGRSSMETRFGLPASIVEEDITALCRRLVQRPYAALGGHTLLALVDSVAHHRVPAQPAVIPATHRAPPARKRVVKPAKQARRTVSRRSRQAVREAIVLSEIVRI